jgi:hypothetical protein
MKNNIQITHVYAKNLSPPISVSCQTSSVSDTPAVYRVIVNNYSREILGTDQ